MFAPSTSILLTIIPERGQKLECGLDDFAEEEGVDAISDECLQNVDLDCRLSPG
jgi:hypothetical protein